MKSILKNPFTITTLVYVLSVLVISPWHDIAINDDWDFYLHVRYLLDGYFTKNSLIDSVFIFQGFLGYIWAKLFGLSFVSLRVLTIIFNIIFIYGTSKVLKQLKVNKKVSFVALFTVTFNPIIFTSSLTFMTETYFLAFFIFSLYFYIKYFETKNFKSLIYACLLALISGLIRQFGLVVFASYLLFSLIKKEKKDFLIILVFALVTALVSLNWPQYSVNSLSIGEKISKFFVSFESFWGQVQNSVWVLTYLGLFLLPFVGLVIKNKKRFFVIFLLSCVFFISVYNSNIFPIGNVFYLEGLYSKNDFIHDIHLFDNIPFKLFISFITTFSVISFIFFILDSFSLKKLSDINLLFLILSLVMFFSVIFANGIFDRYFINLFFVLTLWISYSLRDYYGYQVKYYLLPILLIFIISLFLNIEFFNSNKIKWAYAQEIQKERELSTEVFVNGAFTRLHTNLKYKDPKDVKRPVTVGIKWECFAQNYTIENENILNKLLKRFENSRTINKYIINPKIPDSNDTPRIREITKNLDKLIKQERYFSPVYNIIGKDAYVGIYCASPK